MPYLFSSLSKTYYFIYYYKSHYFASLTHSTNNIDTDARVIHKVYILDAKVVPNEKKPNDLQNFSDFTRRLLWQQQKLHSFFMTRYSSSHFYHYHHHNVSSTLQRNVIRHAKIYSLSSGRASVANKCCSFAIT